MKKITYLTFCLVFLTFIGGCTGYKPIFGTSNLKFEIAEYSIEGNKELGKKIYSKLYRLSKTRKNDLDVRSINILIDVKKNKNSTIKNTAGKILEYKISLRTNVVIKDFLTNIEIINYVSTSSSSYKVQDQYSETLKLENQSLSNLIDKAYGDLIIKITEKNL